ncbi:MAG: hypothetical protein UY04_C0035G0005 [Parcubacteria group bacterium GW2011_GWA2_47_7]|nr:MAG: hypothetical protein UY04_C0035G0005 [Parcubacteria group bacterium GW2011_GWA2_47_7]
MPRQILKHQCTICERIYEDEAHAIKCEYRGARPYSLIPLQVVEFRVAEGMNAYLMVITESTGLNEDCDPHELPRKCVVAYRKGILDNDEKYPPTLDEQQVFASMISPIAHTKNECPLCHSGLLRLEASDYFLNVSAIEVRWIPLVENTLCENCGAKYFTEAQLGKMKEVSMA